MSQPSPAAASAAMTPQQAHPTFINLPQPPSNPDTPSEMPGTPTSTTTSLSALSTTAIKDGHRGHANLSGTHRGHHHNASTNSLEAERADRISRLTGFSGMTTLRPSHGSNYVPGQGQQATPMSAAAILAAVNAGALTPAYFDAQGQPVVVTKMSTVGTASATDSLGARTLGEGDQDMADGDEDLLSVDTNYHETSTETDDASGYMGGTGGDGGDGGDIDPMDEDLASRSVGGFEDRMSDDGSASLVAFGEGAGSTVSGPIYQRRPLPSSSSGPNVWAMERSSSGLSDGALLNGSSGGSNRREVRFSDREGLGGGVDTPVSMSAALERREARMVDGVATDGATAMTAPADSDTFVDTTTRGPLPIGPGMPVQANQSSLRETMQPYSHQQRQYSRGAAAARGREAIQRMINELDDDEAQAGPSGAMTGPDNSGERQGRFYFEDRK